MHGRGSMVPLHPNNKWNAVHLLMKERQIGVLALQETHLTEDAVGSLQSMYGRRLVILSSPSPDKANAKGVAFVLNRDVANAKDVVMQTVVPGRAILLTLPWHQSLTLRILNIYAPNAPQENEAFWSELSEYWRSSNLPKPDILLGDFNVTEDAIDRLPAHHDTPGAIEALHLLKEQLHLQDGWRATNPSTKAYSLLQIATGSQSRIDRIYATEPIIRTATDWAIQDTPVNTDHRMVSVRVVDQKMPYVGRGHWTMPLFLLKDKEFADSVHAMGLKLQNDVHSCEGARTELENPQALFKQFKDAVTARARARAKVMVPKLEAQVKRKQAQLDALLNKQGHEDGYDMEELTLTASVLQQDIARLEKLRYQKARMTTAARYRLEGETISKYWSQVNKEKSPRDVIFALKAPGATP
ncbi:Transposon TX1 uncharacterized protein [Grifola frondosa]|uniref:Transposon TX1 uncharacterized protein n=1 Tax=Grifola frondosa TaxID=5627 RepID=A0A1C7M651_GRIFR|nr:Transposon TX1 uncharacterized protein [Grifola frondosa]